MGESSLPTLNSCLCCVSLQLGSLIIGWYYAVTGIMALMMLYPMMYSFVSQLSTTGEAGPIVAKLIFVEYVVLLQMTVFAAIYLIYGVRRRRPDYVQPFVIIGSVFVIYTSFVILMLAFTPLRWELPKLYATSHIGKDIADSIYHPVSKTIDLAIGIYLLLVVSSYYKELKKTSEHSPGAVV